MDTKMTHFHPNVLRLPSTRAWFSLATVWILLASILLFVVTNILNGAFPIFALVMLIIPLIVVLRSRNAGNVGISPIRWDELGKYTVLGLMGSLTLMIIFEPWSHTYQTLLTMALVSTHPDTTFGWLVHFPGLTGWAGFILYAGFVTLFAEELFFRGWVLNVLKTRMSDGKAVIWQSILFTLPQTLAAFLLPPVQGILYAIVYSWLAIGLINGWAASRTRSIWPGLLSATLYNLVMCIASL